MLGGFVSAEAQRELCDSLFVESETPTLSQGLLAPSSAPRGMTPRGQGGETAAGVGSPGDLGLLFASGALSRFRYIFLEYAAPAHALDAVKNADGYKLDKQHTFRVNLFTDFDK